MVAARAAARRSHPPGAARHLVRLSGMTRRARSLLRQAAESLPSANCSATTARLKATGSAKALPRTASGTFALVSGASPQRTCASRRSQSRPTSPLRRAPAAPPGVMLCRRQAGLVGSPNGPFVLGPRVAASVWKFGSHSGTCPQPREGAGNSRDVTLRPAKRVCRGPLGSLLPIGPVQSARAAGCARMSSFLCPDGEYPPDGPTRPD